MTSLLVSPAALAISWTRFSCQLGLSLRGLLGGGLHGLLGGRLAPASSAASAACASASAAPLPRPPPPACGVGSATASAAASSAAVPLGGGCLGRGLFGSCLGRPRLPERLLGRFAARPVRPPRPTSSASASENSASARSTSSVTSALVGVGVGEHRDLLVGERREHRHLVGRRSRASA